MTILNLMLGSGRGGLEQAALDYAEALAHANINALTVISPGAWAQAPLVAANLPHQTLENFARWDPIAIWKLHRLARSVGARAIICHGNRALSLALCAVKGHVPIIAVAHNTSTQRFARADHCFSITRTLIKHLESGGSKTITLMPNMARVPVIPARSLPRTPPIIGAMGRFVPKKGFDIFIDALAILAQRGIVFNALLGGDGDEHDALHARVKACRIEDRVTFIGWVNDKQAFFDGIDLFVVPSHIEAFGIILIEAMAHAVPTITTDADGPREIAHDDVDAIVVKCGDAAMLADALIRLLNDPALATRIGTAGRELVARDYSVAAMATRLRTALAPYLV